MPALSYRRWQETKRYLHCTALHFDRLSSRLAGMTTDPALSGLVGYFLVRRTETCESPRCWVHWMLSSAALFFAPIGKLRKWITPSNLTKKTLLPFLVRPVLTFNFRMGKVVVLRRIQLAERWKRDSINTDVFKRWRLLKRIVWNYFVGYDLSFLTLNFKKLNK